MSALNSKDDPRRQEKRRVSRKYLSLFLLMLVWGALIIIKMAMVMFGERQYWNEVARSMTPVNRVIEPRRGNILSDDGLLLASSMKQYRVFLDFRTSEKDPVRAQKDQTRKDTLYNNHLAEFARQMHEIFPKYSVQEFASHYESGFKSKSHSWPLLPGVSRNSYPISYNQYKSLSGTVWLKPRYEMWFYSAESKISRQKPFGALAARTIGSMYEAKDSARNGLELSFDSLLRGVPGRGHQEKVQNVTRMVADVPQIDGCDVHTTINVDMQDIAEVALRKVMDEHNAASGIVVLMEVPTGDIKAIASLTKTGPGQFDEIQNNAVREIYEPGSTFKPVSMMVALDDGKISLTDSVFCENGVYTGFGGSSGESGSPDPSGYLSFGKARARTSSISPTRWNSMPSLTFASSLSRSRLLNFGIRMVFTMLRLAARTFSFRPPIGMTLPRSESSPVMAMSAAMIWPVTSE